MFKTSIETPIKSPTKSWTGALLCVVALSVLSACAGIQSTKAPGADLTQLKTFYAQRLPADQRGIGGVISDWQFIAEASRLRLE